MLLGREIAGLWRPRKSGSRLDIAVTPWRRLSGAEQASLSEQAERLASHRGVRLGSVSFSG